MEGEEMLNFILRLATRVFYLEAEIHLVIDYMCGIKDDKKLLKIPVRLRKGEQPPIKINSVALENAVTTLERDQILTKELSHRKYKFYSFNRDIKAVLLYRMYKLRDEFCAACEKVGTDTVTPCSRKRNTSVRAAVWSTLSRMPWRTTKCATAATGSSSS